MKRRRGDAPIHISTNNTTQPYQTLRGDIVVTSNGLLKPGYISFDNDGNITSISKQTPNQNTSVQTFPIIIPGFVDIHNHGVGGAEDVIDYWNNPSYNLSRLAKQGTTSCLATVVFPDPGSGDIQNNSKQNIRSKVTCDTISTIVNQNGYGCVVRGIHAEGPVVATLGGLPDSSKQAAGDLDSFHLLLNNIGPYLKMMTISPSCDTINNYQRFQLLAERNIKISLGHDKNCTESEILKVLHAVKPMRCHMTHVFNVQSFHHRNSGLANFALVSKFPSLIQYQGIEPPTVEVIGDLKHVSPMALRALLGARSPTDMCCITDAIAESIPGKTIKYSSTRLAEVSNDGTTVNIAGSNVLCGSCTNMHETFRRLIDILGVSLEDAVLICATTPSQIVGIDDQVGSIEIGKRGDLLLLDDKLNLMETVIGGCSVWQQMEPYVVKVGRRKKAKRETKKK